MIHVPHIYPSIRMGADRGGTLCLFGLFLFVACTVRLAVGVEPVVLQTPSVRFQDRVLVTHDRPGIVSQVRVREGDAVEAHQILAEMESSVQRSAFAVAEFEADTDVEVRLADRRHEAAEIEYGYVLQANSRQPKTYPESEVQRLKVAAQVSELEAEVQRYRRRLAELRRDQAAAELATLQIRAPFDALVTKVHKSTGSLIGQQDVLLELVSVSSVCVDGYVTVSETEAIRQGDVAKLTYAGIGGKPQEVSGRVRFVDVSIQSLRGVVRVITDFDNSQGWLREGMTAQVLIMPTIAKQ